MKERAFDMHFLTTLSAMDIVKVLCVAAGIFILIKGMGTKPGGSGGSSNGGGNNNSTGTTNNTTSNQANQNNQNNTQ